jgi:hypothetical protein
MCDLWIIEQTAAPKKRPGQKCLASRNKKKNPKKVSHIFEIFRIISDEAAFETPFIRKQEL